MLINWEDPHAPSICRLNVGGICMVPVWDSGINESDCYSLSLLSFLRDSSSNLPGECVCILRVALIIHRQVSTPIPNSLSHCYGV